MITTPAASITKAASKQTYYTIRFLADRDRGEDAYRAYGYFRWVDDVLDADAGTSAERLAFLERQKFLLECCYREEWPQDIDFEEQILVELIKHDREKNSGLQSYLRNMMQVMDFDVKRRGRLISQAELNEYTRWLANAVIEGLHYFVGHDGFSPHNETRYLAVSAAHIVHMLRDTADDAAVGYHNIPREILEANQIGPMDVQSEAYRAWVKSRVNLARKYFESGKQYFARVQNLRCRLAGVAYISRFEWLLNTIEREGYSLRSQYDEKRSLGTALKMTWLVLSSLIIYRGIGNISQPVSSNSLGQP
jgi:phytoene/squalene synthetase